MRLVGVLAACAGPACTEASVSSPTALGTNLPVAVEVFTGTLPVNGVRFYSFTVSKTGSASVVLLSLTENGEPSSAAVQIGIGAPRGIDCLATQTATIGPGAVAQVGITADPAVYCARIADVGNLQAPAQFAINIIRPR
jgi:hypothetical protein